MRRTATALLVLLAAVLPAVAVSSWWIYGQATDTTTFMRTAGPLATDPTVQRVVVDDLVAAADARLRASPVPIPGGSSAARARVRAIAESVVGTEAYRQSWLATQRTTHARLAARLTGSFDAPLTLDLGRVATVLRARVADTGLPQVAAAITDPRPVTLADRAEVRRARTATGVVRIARAISVPGAVLAIVGVLLTAPWFTRGVVRAAACLAVAAMLLVAGWLAARELIAAHHAAGDLAVAVYDVLTRPLRPWVIGGAAGALAVAVAGTALGGVQRR